MLVGFCGGCGKRGASTVGIRVADGVPGRLGVAMPAAPLGSHAGVPFCAAAGAGAAWMTEPAAGGGAGRLLTGLTAGAARWPRAAA
jgi:hypothetical protein